MKRLEEVQVIKTRLIRAPNSYLPLRRIKVKGRESGKAFKLAFRILYPAKCNKKTMGRSTAVGTKTYHQNNKRGKSSECATGIYTGIHTRTARRGISHPLGLPEDSPDSVTARTLEAPAILRNSIKFWPRDIEAHPSSDTSLSWWGS